MMDYQKYLAIWPGIFGLLCIAISHLLEDFKFVF